MQDKMSTLTLLLLVNLSFVVSAGAQTVLVEAESFADRGGWVVQDSDLHQSHIFSPAGTRGQQANRAGFEIGCHDGFNEQTCEVPISNCF